MNLHWLFSRRLLHSKTILSFHVYSLFPIFISFSFQLWLLSLLTEFKGIVPKLVFTTTGITSLAWTVMFGRLFALSSDTNCFVVNYIENENFAKRRYKILHVCIYALLWRGVDALHLAIFDGILYFSFFFSADCVCVCVCLG